MNFDDSNKELAFLNNLKNLFIFCFCFYCLEIDLFEAAVPIRFHFKTNFLPYKNNSSRGSQVAPD